MHRALVLVLAAAACAPGGSDDAETAGEETGATTGEPLPEPDFLSPAVGAFEVQAAQIAPEELIVRNVVPGNTQVLLDGYSLGTLEPGDKFGTLTEDSLSLTLHGALTVGAHTVQMVTTSPDGPLYSAELTMEVREMEQRPDWTAELDAAPVATGEALVAAGIGAGGVLGVVAAGDADPELRLFLAGAGGWATDLQIVVPLEGHVPGNMSFAPAVGAVGLPDEDGAVRRARVVYRVGLPGRAIASRDIVINPDPIVLNAVTAFDLDGALAGEEFEWAAFGRPFALGHTLVAELTAVADAEVPHPGDRRLISAFWRGDDLQWTAPQHIGTPAPSDLDALGPAPVLVDIPAGAATTLAVRLGGAFPGLLEVRDNGAVSITSPTDSLPLTVSGELGLATIVSSYGSRTVGAVDRDGRFSLSLLATGQAGKDFTASPKPEELPDSPPTGAPAAGVSLGFPVFLVPYGAASPVQLVYSDGRLGGVRALELPEPLHCDEVALASTLGGNDPEDSSLPLACLYAGELRVGRLRATPAPG